MHQLEITQQMLARILFEFGVHKSEITSDARFHKDLGLDSLDMAAMIVETEEAFGINIPDKDVPHLETVEKLIKYLHHQSLYTSQTQNQVTRNISQDCQQFVICNL